MSLTGAQLHQAARETARSFTDDTTGHPFAPHLEAWKVRGEVFLIVTEDDEQLQIVTVKADPTQGEALRDEHPSFTRGRYLDKQQWISVGPGPGITRQLVEDLVRDSHDLADPQRRAARGR